MCTYSSITAPPSADELVN